MPTNPDKPEALKFDRVSHRYGKVPSVSQISFSVPAGQIVCLLGPSGCGKSTILRLAAGLENPDSGRIAINGLEMASTRRATPPEKRPISMVFQDYALFPHLNVLQNIVFGLRQVPAKDRYRRARDVLDKVGLAAEETRFPHTLSGGQQQRVALARATALRTAVMLMDEPFSNLDINLRYAVREEARKILHGEGSATVLVTHDAEEATQMGDRILLLDRGTIVQAGTPDEFYFAPQTPFAARFFGDTNTIPGRITNGTLECPLGSWRFGGPLREGSAEIVVRHQAFVFRPPAEGSDFYREVSVRVVESRILGGKRLTTLAVTDDLNCSAIHRMTTRFSPGDFPPCWLDTRLVFPFPQNE